MMLGINVKIEWCKILLIADVRKGSDLLIRGTQRLFSVQHLFGEANIAENFLLLEQG